MNKYGNDWTLIDDSHTNFNRWEHRSGYTESFWKGKNPNKKEVGEIIGKLIEDYCEDEGVTKREFGKRIGVTEGTVTSYINGRNPGPEIIEKIESVMGLKIM